MKMYNLSHSPLLLNIAAPWYEWSVPLTTVPIQPCFDGSVLFDNSPHTTMLWMVCSAVTFPLVMPHPLDPVPYGRWLFFSFHPIHKQTKQLSHILTIHDIIHQSVCVCDSSLCVSHWSRSSRVKVQESHAFPMLTHTKQWLLTTTTLPLSLSLPLLLSLYRLPLSLSLFL